LGQSQHLNRGGGDQVEGRSIKAQPRPENKPSHIRNRTWTRSRTNQ